MKTLDNSVFREATYNEYKEFSELVVDKVQLAEANSVILSENNSLVIIKILAKDLINIREFLSTSEFEEVDIEHFNKGVLKDRDVVKIDKSFYENKNFIIKK